MKKLSIDFEFSSRAWWENGGQGVWAAVTEGFDGRKGIVDAELASSWLERARAIPGWDDGAEYAPHPVRASALDDDELDLARARNNRDSLQSGDLGHNARARVFIGCARAFYRARRITGVPALPRTKARRSPAFVPNAGDTTQ